MVVVDIVKGTVKGTITALSRTCPVCGAKPGEFCEDPDIPAEAQPGWHTEREEVQDEEKEKN